MFCESRKTANGVEISRTAYQSLEEVKRNNTIRNMEKKTDFCDWKIAMQSSRCFLDESTAITTSTLDEIRRQNGRINIRFGRITQQMVQYLQKSSNQNQNRWHQTLGPTCQLVISDYWHIFCLNFRSTFVMKLLVIRYFKCKKLFTIQKIAKMPHLAFCSIKQLVICSAAYTIQQTASKQVCYSDPAVDDFECVGLFIPN